MNKEEKILELLTRGVTEVIDKERLSFRLSQGKKLRVKLGIDPTSPNIHIGRGIVLWKLRAFQELGHKVVLIVGDFTALVGDTSDKDAERPMLEEAQVKSNLKDYLKQAFLILDKNKTETCFNSKWLKKLGFGEIAKIANEFSVHEFIARENIHKRLKSGKRISLREVIYPLMQGYDSVAVKADVEIGGNDQRFNLLAGRAVQPIYGQAPQEILMTEILEGLDGRKMSSSWGNTINLTDSPNEMFGKVMTLKDDLIEKYLTLATRVDFKKIKEIMKAVNPRDAKLELAGILVEMYHGSKKAEEAKEEFLRVFSKKELPSDMEELVLRPGKYKLSQLLTDKGILASKTEVRRLIEQKGIKIEGEVVLVDEIDFVAGEEKITQIGKRRFYKFIVR